MGGKSTKSQNTAGAVINEIQVKDNGTNITNNEIIVPLYIITAILLFAFIIKLHKLWQQRLRNQLLAEIQHVQRI